MNIPNNYFIFIDILVGLIFLFNIIKSFKNGFVFELLNLIFLLVSFIAAWFIAPVLASKASLISLDNPIEGYLNLTEINVVINTVVWLIIIVLVLNLLFMLVKPIFKAISKVPVLGFFNRILGVLVGLFNSLIVCLLLSMLLTLPIIKNSNEVKNGTVFKYSETVTNGLTKFVLKNIDLSKIQSNIKDFDVESARNNVVTWLVDQGILDE